MTLTQGVDRTTAQLKGLLAAWQQLDPQNKGMTTQEVMEVMTEKPFHYPQMMKILTEMFDIPPEGKLPPASKLSYKLRSMKERNSGGLCFVGDEGHDGITRWRTRRIDG